MQQPAGGGWWRRGFQHNSFLFFGVPFLGCFLGTTYFLACILEIRDSRIGSRNHLLSAGERESFDRIKAASRIDLAQEHARLVASGKWNDYQMVPMPPPPEQYPLLRGAALDAALIEMSARDSVVTPEEERRRRRANRRRAMAKTLAAGSPTAPPSPPPILPLMAPGDAQHEVAAQAK